MLKKLTNYLPRYFLVTLYKVFIRLDYVDIISDKPNNMNIYDKIESLKYDDALAITGAIRGSSKENLYQELGFEYLSSRRLFRKLCLFYKIVVNKLPNLIMLQQLINPIKLEEVVTKFYICGAEKSILRALSFRAQSRNTII